MALVFSRWRRPGIALGALISLAVLASAAKAEDSIFKNKRLTLVINFAVGGPTDLEGRLLAKHLVKYLDGVAGINVQNMEGAGGIIGVNYVGEVAPRDGLTFGYVTGAAMQSVVEMNPRRVEFKSYEFIGYLPGTTIHFARTDLKPGLKTAADIAKAQGVVVGGLGPDSAKDLSERLTLDMLGVKFKYVTGYKGAPAARLALQQNEISYYAESPPTYRNSIEPDLVRGGAVLPLYYDSESTAPRAGVEKQVEGLPITPFPALYEKVKGAPPSGKFWDAYKSIAALNGAMLRLLIYPPNTSPATVAAMRTAITRLGHDEDYQREAMQIIGFAPTIVAGPDTSEQVRAALTIPSETQAFIANYIKNPPN